MVFEVTAGIKSVEADSALKRLLTCVNPQVNFQIPFLCEEFAAQLALKFLHVPMNRADMPLDISFARQYFMTNWTLAFLLRIHVLFLLLSKGLYFLFLVKT